MKTPKLIANEFYGEGYIKMPAEWAEEDSLLKADILKDWIYALQLEYDSCLIKMRSEAMIRKAKMKELNVSATKS